MSRWNVGNRFLGIKLEEFQDYAGELKKAFERHVQSDCDVQVEFFNGIPFESSWVDDLGPVDHSDKITGRVDDLADVTLQAWNEAAFVKVCITDRSDAHQFAQIHAKGQAPKKMTVFTNSASDGFGPEKVSSGMRVTARDFYCGYPNMGRG